MSIVRHAIEIESSIEEVYSICAEVEKWPDRFPPCQSVKILENKDNKQRFEITALADNTPMTWESERELDAESRTIVAHQTKPSPLVKSMYIAWRIDPIQTGVLLSLEHRFDIKNDVKGLVETVETPEEALTFMKNVIHANSTRELAAIKQILETGDGDTENTTEFQEELVIDAGPEKIFALLRNARAWPEVLPHCLSTEIVYDDGKNQEFRMTVDVQGKPEKIRTIRRCLPYRHIDYFQPDPPPLLKHHTGQWTLKPLTGGATQVISRHRVTIKPEKIQDVLGDLTVAESLRRVQNAINKNSMNTMRSIQVFLTKA